jgi:hypothetical protein
MNNESYPDTRIFTANIRDFVLKGCQVGWTQTTFASALSNLPPEDFGRFFGEIFREREIIYDASQKPRSILKFYEGGHLAMPYKPGEK